MPSNDLLDYATSEHAEDFYELLGVEHETVDADIRKAYRRTALKHHPDKNQGNLKAVEKFHLVQIAYDVLSDPAAKAAYDNARAARRAKAKKRTELDGKRRAFIDDLEQRENAFKRKREDEDEAELKLQREIKRLAEEGRRRREEMTEKLKREQEEAEAEARAKQLSTTNGHEAEDSTSGGNRVTEMDRSVKVRWVREGAGLAVDTSMLSDMFSRFGEVDVALIIGKEKKQRLHNWKNKKLIATALIVYKSIVGAHAAVEDAPSLFETDPSWREFVSIKWGSKKEEEAPVSQKTDFATLTPPPVKTTGAVPSFGSFKSASLEEITMMRLKSAEKKRLEEQIRKEEEEQQNGSPNSRP